MDFEPRAIEGTTLVVTGVRYQESQTSLFREERGQSVTLLEVTDTKTGVRGHIYHELETDKRDIEHEEIYTDTPALFQDNHPEMYLFQDLACCGPAGTPSERDDAINAIILSCCDNQLEYRAADPDAESYEAQGWGLFPI